MPQPKKDAVIVHMKMDRTTHDKLDKYCAETGLSRTAAIEKILKEHLVKYSTDRAIVRKEIDITKPLTDEQIKMLEEAEAAPIVFDEDCPELTEEQLSEFHRVSEIRKKEQEGKTNEQ